MKNCKVKYDRLEVLKYHVLKSIAADPEEFLRQVLPRGKITGGGVFIDEELKFRVRYKHNNNSNGNIGMWTEILKSMTSLRILDKEMILYRFMQK